MKKILLILLVVALAFALSSCGFVEEAKEKAEDVVKDGIKAVEDEVNNVLASDTEIDSDEDQDQDQDSDDDKDSNPLLSKGDNFMTYDSNLEGQALIDSIEYNVNSDEEINYRFMTEIYYGNDLTSVTETILFKGDYKTINKQDNITSYIIHLGDEGVTYSWIEGDAYGTVFYDDPDDPMYDTADFNTSYLVPEDVEILEARIEDYKGYECLYIQYLDPYSSNMTANLWLSVAYGMQVMVETYENDVLLMSLESYDIERVKSVPADTFNIPNDVVFEEFDWNFDLDDFDLDGLDLDGLDLDGLDLDGLDLNDLDLDDLNLDLFN